MATRFMPLAAVLLLCLAGCVTPDTYKTSADFKRPEAGYRLVVMKPDIAVSLLTAGGQLELRWSREPGLGGNGRGCQVSEVWLIRR